jgi:AI-2 transport protein TqsA
MEGSRFVRISVGIIVLFILGVFLKLAKPVLFPFLLAVFISYLLDPVLRFLLRRKVPKAAAIVLILFVAFVLLYLLGALLYSSGKSFASSFPLYEQRINEIIRGVEEFFGSLPFESRVSSFMETVDVGRTASFLVSAMGPFFRFAARLFLVFLFVVFIFSGRGRLQEKLREVLDPERAERVTSALRSINHQIRRYLAIKTLMSLLNGLEVWLVLELFNVDFAFLFGFLAFLLNYIPNIGSFIATALRVGFAFFQFGTIWVPLWIYLITSGIDMVLGNVIEPRIMGKGLGLSPLVVIFSLIFWGWLWGISGMILAIPLVAVLKIVCQNVPALKPAAVMLE